MHRFWISLPVALALAVPPAYAGKLGSVEQVAKTLVAKKATSSASHGFMGNASHGKASGLLSKGKKLVGK